MRATILRWGCAAILLAIVGSCAVAVDLTKEDIDFRKEVYVDKKGDKLPYRLFVPIGYSSANTYPLVLSLHGGEGRGNDDVKQVARGNEKGRRYGAPAKYRRSFPHLYWRHRGPWGRTGPTRNSIGQPTRCNGRWKFLPA